MIIPHNTYRGFTFYSCSEGQVSYPLFSNNAPNWLQDPKKELVTGFQSFQRSSCQKHNRKSCRITVIRMECVAWTFQYQAMETDDQCPQHLQSTLKLVYNSTSLVQPWGGRALRMTVELPTSPMERRIVENSFALNKIKNCYISCKKNIIYKV